LTDKRKGSKRGRKENRQEDKAANHFASSLLLTGRQRKEEEARYSPFFLFLGCNS